MSRKEAIQAIALLVMVASMPLFAWGANDESMVIVVVAAVLLAVGASTLTVLRFLAVGDE